MDIIDNSSAFESHLMLDNFIGWLNSQTDYALSMYCVREANDTTFTSEVDHITNGAVHSFNEYMKECDAEHVAYTKCQIEEFLLNYVNDRKPDQLGKCYIDIGYHYSDSPLVSLDCIVNGGTELLTMQEDTCCNTCEDLSAE